MRSKPPVFATPRWMVPKSSFTGRLGPSASEIPKRRRVITGNVSHDVVYSNIVSQSAVAANDGEPVMFIFDRSSACAKMAARTSGE